MDSVHNVLVYIYLSTVPVLVFCFSTCAKKKPPRNSAPGQSAMSQPPSSGAPLSQPVPNASTDPIQKSKEKDTKTVGAPSAGAQPPSPPPVPTGSDGKQEGTDPNKEAGKETKETDKKPGPEVKVAGSNEKPEQKDAKKDSKEPAKDPSVPQKEAAPSTPAPATPAPASSAPATPAAAPPTPAPTPNPPPNEANQPNQPRGMEIHKSMKVRNKKKEKSKDQTAPGKSPVPATDVKSKNTKKGELKQTTGEEEDDDDDETLRAASSSSSSVWKVIDEQHHDVCIQMEASISLNLSYVTQSQSIQYGYFTLPSTLTVNSHLSSCNKTVNINGTQLVSQILHLDFDSHKDPGWSIEFSFTQDHRLHASDTEFTLYRVGVVANYSTQPKIFPNPLKDTEEYIQPIDFSASEVSIIADNIYANTHYSYSCSSLAKYPINTDSSFGQIGWISLKNIRVQAFAPDGTTNSLAKYPINTDSSFGQIGWISLKNIRVQAFAPDGTTKFGDREICPQDQTGDDLVPVIVGSVLAGMVIVTLVIYLVYRARQPPEVLYWTNQNSHFDDLAVMRAQKEEEDDDESHHVPHSVARHLETGTPPRNGTLHVRYENSGFEE
uniref:Uncharacterized protein n=1 Tax=Panagrolaimus sp. JU765 TaxID=591449 RepID=A0AC34R4J3_9BILA